MPSSACKKKIDEGFANVLFNTTFGDIWCRPGLPTKLRSLFFFEGFGVHRDLHSFPTRRSSDLDIRHRFSLSGVYELPGLKRSKWTTALTKNWRISRSEEHTSELQSRLHLVC